MNRGLTFISAAILYSLDCDAINVRDDDYIVTSLEEQIQISVALIG